MTSTREMKFAILRYLGRPTQRHEHKVNLIGRRDGPGNLELFLDVRFDDEQRFCVDRAFEELLTAGLIRPTYADAVSPEKWAEITSEGRDALERHALDSLDEALATISPSLVEMRDGAWAAAQSRQPDATRQAAHSARELIDQTLKTGAPDMEVRRMPGFAPERGSRDGISRRHRLRCLMLRRRGAVSESALEVADAACELVLKVDARLMGLAHSRGSPSAEDARDAITAAEVALRHVLVAPE